MPRFAGRRALVESALVSACAAVVSIAALAFFASRGWLLYFGDAEAHLNIARRIIDSRTPGFDQIGTVWLPLPHLLTLALVWNDAWWQSGIAGSIPSAAAFVAATVLLYATARRVFGSRLAAVTAAALFALNPNILYLQSIPMTESILLGSLIGLLYSTVLYAQTGSVWAVVLAGVFSNAASLTRYEGWFVIPFVTLYLAVAAGWRRWWVPVVFGAIASAAPLAWLAHNWWYYSNAFEFYNGPYSAKGIYERALRSGLARAPGDHNWVQAAQYYWAAARLCAGTPLAILGLAGAAVAARRRWWPFLFLTLPAAFYIWSIHSSGANIFVPHLWPFSYYNTRYGSILLPLFAAGGAALVWAVPVRWQRWSAGLAVGVAVAPWFVHARADGWIVWKESQVNSETRRAWTTLTAGYLRQHYGAGDGVFTGFGDLTGIFRSTPIVLRETLHEGNNPYWNAAERRADLFLFEPWAVAFSGDPVATAIQRANARRPLYDLIERVHVRGSPVIEIYRRTGGHGAVADLCRRGLIANCDAAPASGSNHGPEEEER